MKYLLISIISLIICFCLRYTLCYTISKLHELSLGIPIFFQHIIPCSHITKVNSAPVQLIQLSIARMSNSKCVDIRLW